MSETGSKITHVPTAWVRLEGSLADGSGRTSDLKAMKSDLLCRLATCRSLIVDLSRVDVMDTSFAAILVEVCATARACGAYFSITNASEAVTRVLKLFRLEGVLNCQSSPA